MAKLITLILIFILNACSTNQENNGRILNTVTSYADNSKTIAEEDFQLFWNAFRQAILDNDSVRLVKMTNFPLKSHGNLDDDPQPLIAKGKFYQFLQKCLNEQTGMTPNNETNLDYIKRTINLVDDRYYTHQTDWCRVSSFEFQKIENNWKLTLIYFDTNENNQ